MRSKLGMAGLAGPLVVFLPLFAILAAAVGYAVHVWSSLDGPPMPAAGYVAMAAGVILSLAIGVGLMSLLFYSRRHGYDELGEAERSEEHHGHAGDTAPRS